MHKDWPNFDELKRLAEQSPEKLEEFRQREIEAIIAQAPEGLKRRLQGIQFQVNCQRQLHSSPLGSCVAISKMMHESFAKLNAVLNGKPYAHDIRENGDSNIIPFAG